jgi:hypothetical protein
MVIEVYQEMIRYFGNNDPTTRTMLEHILSEEEEHASDLSDLLYVVDPHTGEAEGRDPGADPLEIDSRRRGTQSRTAQESSLVEDEYEPSLARRERGGGPSQLMSPGAAENARGRNREYNGTQQSPATARNQQRRTQAEASPRTNEKTSRGGATMGTREESQPAHEPGTTGRPMNRRKNVEEREDVDMTPAERPNRGGMSGGTRSPKILQKNRKNKRVA